MRKLVYDALPLFTETERRLRNGERIVTYECELPDCIPNRGKIYFHLQSEGIVVGVCDMNNQKVVRYNGDNRDLKYLVKHQAICFDNILQIYNMFFRMDAIYSSSDNIMTYYIDGYGYYKNGKYKFEFIKKNGSWRAYILEMPDFEGRDTSCSITHRLTDGDRKYVCVRDSVPTKERMKEIAKFWANKEQNYIKTGERF